MSTILASDIPDTALLPGHTEESGDWHKCASPLDPQFDQESGDWHKCASPLDPQSREAVLEAG
jgi:hypothetical protein